MRVSLDWLSEFITLDKPAEEIADILTMAGLEVEAIELADDDLILEVNVTPNRGDCLSLLGIARELAVLTGKPLKMLPCEVKGETEPGKKIEIRDETLCRRYTGRIIKNIKPGPSPRWLQKRLESYGMRPINNIVDVTNYVLVELGHPLHAFDLNTLKGDSIIIDTADKIYQKIKTLDGIERKLPEDALVIADTEGPVAVAGVMGGALTEVEESTTSIFLESAWFKPQSIRKTSKALGLGSESSYRFERGTDLEILPVALDRATCLLQELAGGVPSKKLDAYPVKFTPARIETSPGRVNRLLGTAIEKKNMISILDRLGFSPEEKASSIMVTPPSYRNDIEREADIVEEIARIYGYNGIPTALPSSSLSAEGIGPMRKFMRQVKNVIRGAGFDEAINFSFMSPDALDFLELAPGDIRRNAVRILNPLRKEESLLRTTIIMSLLEDLKYNLSRDIRSIRLFEVSKVFIRDEGEDLPREPLKLGGIFMAQKTYRFWQKNGEDFYIVKGVVEALLDEFRITGRSFEKCQEPFLHPGKSAKIVIGGKDAGFVGVLSPVLKEKLDIKAREDVLVFELDLYMVIENLPAVPVYGPIPKFPYMERDVAIVVEEYLRAADILKLIREYPSEYIEDAVVFDLYKGGKLGPGKKSLAFNIRYRSGGKTLTEEEIDSIHKGVIASLLEKTGGSIRQ
ncbi:MAG: phenylalanine--tRNA ligase subunit beta [Nitrospiraceae bacterium]|nr:phenylalanine--tRNA ligase subunit beta [Nitrospiraceae bacterium]